MSAAPLSRSTTGTSATGTTSSGESKQKIRHSTGRGGSGNIKRTKGVVSDVAPTSPRAIGGREAANVLPQSSKKLNSGRGGSGNIRARPMLKSSGATSTIVSQYEDKIRDYERNLIETSMLARQAAGSTGRGGSGNISVNKNASSTSNASSAARLNPRYQPRKSSISKDIFTKLKLGKGKKSNRSGSQTASTIFQTASTISSASENPSIFDIHLSSVPSSSRGTTPSITNSIVSSDYRESRPIEDDVQARHRMGLYLLSEQDICEEDDESIYLAYARDDNTGELDVVDDSIPEESEEDSSQSEVEDGASICLVAAGLVDRPTIDIREWGPTTSTTTIPGSAISETFSVHSRETTSHIHTDEEDEEVDPSLRNMRSRYSIAKPPAPSQYLTPSRSTFQSSSRPTNSSVIRDSSRQPCADPTSEGHRLLSFAPATLPRPEMHLELSCSSSHSLTCPPSSLRAPDLDPQQLPSAAETTRARIDRHLTGNHPRLSLLSATDFMADFNTEDDMLPPYTPKATAYSEAAASPTRPLPSVPNQVPRHVPELPIALRAAPLGPRQISHAYSDTRTTEIRPLNTVLNMEDWPSPPTSLPQHRRVVESHSSAHVFLHA